MSLEDDLPSLIGSRICHDLTSPLGAIGNGLELLMLEGATSPELSLLVDSVSAAHARIRFLRVAFGMNRSRQPMPCAEVNSLLSDWAALGRMQIDWPKTQDLPRDEVRQIFLVFLCCETALTYGGRAVLSRDGACWQMELRGPRVTQNADLWRFLTNRDMAAVPLDASHVQFALLRKSLQAGVGMAQISALEDGFALRWLAART